MANGKTKTDLVETPAVPQDIMLKLMTADVPTLRGAFDHATEAWNAEKQRVCADYELVCADNDKRLNANDAEIRSLQAKIEVLRQTNENIKEAAEDSRVAFMETLESLEVKRVFLDNLQNTFSDKMKGFA